MNRYPDFSRGRLREVAQSMLGRIYTHCQPVDSLRVSDGVDRISYAAAEKLKYRPAKAGDSFGPLWTTFWFKVSATVPRAWKGGRVDLLWDSHSEATVWVEGRSTQGLNSDGNLAAVRADAPLLAKCRGGDTLRVSIEMACNSLFGSAGHRGPFVLERCDIGLFDPEAWELYHDYLTLQELEFEQTKDLDKTWGGELLAELNKVALVYDPEDRATWPRARRILRALYRRRNATCVHEMSAIGHAHIDTAWLWPLSETRRKCERTFSTQTAYMDKYPRYKFACSQAAQYDIIEKANPDLFRRIAAKVKAGQFVPVGGTWVEPDCNIPSGESLCRQFLLGQRYFREKFGINCREFWNPDVFGYNGQLPQIMREAGIRWFLTQKLSWNSFNKPWTQTFNWQGIDGSEVLTHFPPANNYNCSASVQELRNSARDYKDHDRSRHSIMLFGFGDGGGGPTQRMIESLARAADLQGLPRTQIRSSEEFFRQLERDCTDRLTIVGELYFEYHRGTYTTQALTKRNNRKNEFLLHDVEFLATWAAAAGTMRYPSAQLGGLWEKLLLNQFHDILPGSSITVVYQDAARDHEEIRAMGERLRGSALGALGGKGKSVTPVNTIGFARGAVAQKPDGSLAYVEAPSYGLGRIVEPYDSVRVVRTGRTVVLENANLKATLSSDGRLMKLFDKQARREALAAPGNVLEIYEDPGDAWDVHPPHLETGKPCLPATDCKISRAGGMRGAVVFTRKIGRASAATQTVRLDACARRLEFHTEVDWRESNRMLKVAFPVAVRAMNATYEMQFGCVERPTHYNTSYDLARYEVPGHKWADLGEAGFGVALLSESKYGYSTHGHVMRMSLLRSPKHPDPEADMGKQSFAYAVMPHAGDWRQAGVVGEGYRFNVPLLWMAGAAEYRSMAGIDDANLVLDTVKKAEDSDSIVVRCYEAHGARGCAKLRLALPFRKAVFCNTLEEPGQAARIAGGVVEIPYRPFQIISLKLT